MRVIAQHVNFLIELPKKVTFSLLGCFDIEIRAFGFLPQFDGLKATSNPGDTQPTLAMQVWRQIHFAEQRDVIDARIDFHDLYVALPARVEDLPRHPLQGPVADDQGGGRLPALGRGRLLQRRADRQESGRLADLRRRLRRLGSRPDPGPAEDDGHVRLPPREPRRHDRLETGLVPLPRSRRDEHPDPGCGDLHPRDRPGVRLPVHASEHQGVGQHQRPPQAPPDAPRAGQDAGQSLVARPVARGPGRTGRRVRGGRSPCGR